MNSEYCFTRPPSFLSSAYSLQGGDTGAQMSLFPFGSLRSNVVNVPPSFLSPAYSLQGGGYRGATGYFPLFS